ncbi:Transposase DDE domain protein (plasmid) [Marinibacterium anthonyi]|nr:Transposase DDE domain protein [Marinibacterium anthonyi]
MSRPATTTYQTTNWHRYNQALRQRGSLTVWFDPSMQWEAAPSGRRDRQQAYGGKEDQELIRGINSPTNAIRGCLTIKVLLGLPLRQTTGFVASLLELSARGWAVPDFNTLSRRQKTLDVTIPYRGSKSALYLLVDSTGIKGEGEGEWHTRKHGGSKRRVWRKIHLGIDEETLEIRAVEVTSGNVGPSRQHAAHAPAGQWTPRCCRTCSPRSRRTRTSPPSRLTVPTTHAPAMLPLRPVEQQRSSHLVETPGPGRRTRQALAHATRSCEHRSTWAGRSGGTGAGTTGAAGSRRNLSGCFLQKHPAGP